MDSTEAELENFRQKWRDEVSARAKGKGKGKASAAEPSPKATVASSSKAHSSRSHATEPHAHAHARHRSVEEVDEVEPHSYHDLGEKQHGRRLDETSPSAVISSQEPTSALEHYEKAVEKESQGSLGDSVNLYRKAFRVSS